MRFFPLSLSLSNSALFDEKLPLGGISYRREGCALFYFPSTLSSQNHSFPRFPSAAFLDLSATDQQQWLLQVFICLFYFTFYLSIFGLTCFSLRHCRARGHTAREDFSPGLKHIGVRKRGLRQWMACFSARVENRKNNSSASRYTHERRSTISLSFFNTPLFLYRSKAVKGGAVAVRLFFFVSQHHILLLPFHQPQI